jgi:hypothetical protein
MFQAFMGLSTYTLASMKEMLTNFDRKVSW